MNQSAQSSRRAFLSLKQWCLYGNGGLPTNKTIDVVFFYSFVGAVSDFDIFDSFEWLISLFTFTVTHLCAYPSDLLHLVPSSHIPSSCQHQVTNAIWSIDHLVGIGTELPKLWRIESVK